MISEEFRTKFKKDLGEAFEYSPEVLKFLKSTNEVNRKGAPYSPHSIRNVFNGRAENKAIEMGIFIVYKRAIKKRKALEALEKEINDTE